MAMNLGELIAYLNVDDSRASAALSNFQQKLYRAGEGASKTGQNISQKFKNVGASVSNAGSSVSQVGGNISKLTAPVGAATVAVGGLVGALGFKRLVGIDTARGQFEGLGYDADKVMEQVDKGVTGTSLSMADGASTAVGILATGSVPLEDLEDQIKRVANVSAAYGVDSSQAAYLLNNVLTKNKVTWGDLSQMQQNGIPIVTALADEYGVTGEKVQKMAEEGKISIDDLNKAIDSKAGKAAEAYAGTWKGVVANITANLGKIGAAALQPAFEIAKDKLGAFLDLLKTDDAMEAAKSIGSSLGGALSTVIDIASKAVTWFTSLSGTWQKIILGAVAFAVAIGPVLLVLGKIISTVGTIISVVGTVIGWVSKLSVVFSLVGKAIGVVSFALRGLWAVMAANPVGAVIAVVAALVAGLIWFFTKTETGQKIWAKVWGGIKAAAAAVADWFMTTLVPIFQAAWDGISAAALWLWHSVFEPAWQGIQAAVSAVAGWVTGTLVPALSSAWQAVADAALWLWHSVIEPAWYGIRVAIALVVAVVMTYMDAWVAIFRHVIAPLFTWLYKSVIQPVWQAIRTAISKVVSWFSGTAVPFIKSAIAITQAAFQAFRAKLAAIWTAVRKNVIQPVLSWFQGTVVAGFKTAVATVRAKFDAFRAGLARIWSAVKNAVILPVYNWFKGTVVAGFKTALAAVRAGFDLMKSKLASIWRAVRSTIIQPVYSWFKTTVVGGFTTALGTVRSKFQAMKDKLSSVWKSIRSNVIQPVYGWFKDTVVGGLKSAADKISSAFKTMKSAVGKAWDGVKAKAKAPIKFVVDTVINKGIVKNFNKIAGKFGVGKLSEVSAGFASGGVLPGYTPGRDVHSFYSPSLGRLDLSGGEAIMRPEFTRAVGGPRGVARLNAAAINGQTFSDAFSTGGVFGSSAGRHAYAGGGVLSWIKDKTSKGANWLKDKASWVKDVVSDPLGVFKTFAKDLLGGTPVAGLMTDLGKAAINKVASGIGNFLKGKNDDAGGGGIPAGTGKGGSLGWASSVAKRFGLTMTSGYRPGARTSSGSLSMHGLNRARDYSNGYETPQEMRFFNYILANSKPTELLYTPAGARNVHRGGRQYANSGTLARIHHNHVHVAYKRGGVLGDLMGRGYASGTLNATPGWHMVGENGPELMRFRGGEQVKNARETRDYMGQSGTVHLTNHFHEVGGEAAEIAAQRVQNRMVRSMREAVRL